VPYDAIIPQLQQLVSDAGQATVYFDLVRNVISASDANPLAEYYLEIKATGVELVSSTDVLRECAYLTGFLPVGNSLPENMAFASIPAGSFEMGSPSSESEPDSSEGPVHTVNIQSFEMMTTEITQGMWQEVMGNNPAQYTGDPNRPVENVSWNDCQEFIAAMNDLDSLYTYRLPSEAEWEYACRAGTTTRYYWGNDPDSTEIEQYAWYDGNSGDTTHPAAQKLPNAWGLYDMSGNVWEWCEDFYHESYSGAPTDGSPWLSPSGSSRVSRGGSWYYNADYCRSAYRSEDSPGYSDVIQGFRLVRSER
jgi:formylglycine-generating enzyme required for sulfatase activity